MIYNIVFENCTKEELTFINIMLTGGELDKDSLSFLYLKYKRRKKLFRCGNGFFPL